MVPKRPDPKVCATGPRLPCPGAPDSPGPRPPRCPPLQHLLESAPPPEIIAQWLGGESGRSHPAVEVRGHGGLLTHRPSLCGSGDWTPPPAQCGGRSHKRKLSVTQRPRGRAVTCSGLRCSRCVPMEGGRGPQRNVWVSHRAPWLGQILLWKQVAAEQSCAQTVAFCTLGALRAQLGHHRGGVSQGVLGCCDLGAQRPASSEVAGRGCQGAARGC